MLYVAKSFRLFLIYFFLHCGLETRANAYVVVGSSAADEAADGVSLLDFRSKVADPFGALRSWNDSLHFCRWEGITCHPRSPRVTRLYLPSKGLVGPLSPSLGNLSFLVSLNIPNNTFQGRIPEELGRLSRLNVLDLSNNSFHGEIPENISHCTELLQIDLGWNKLVGTFPIHIFSISGLKYLQIFENNITGGMPSGIGNLTSLEVLSIGRNPLGGNIPSSIGRLRNLKNLGMGNIRLSGTLPFSIYNLSLLEVLSVSQNQLHGSLPPSMGHSFPKLLFLQMEENKFTGSIPPSLSNVSNLNYVSLQQNNFSGKLRVDFSGMKNLRHLSLTANNLGSGDIDELNFVSSLANCSKLSRLVLSINLFKGVLPSSVANLTTQLRFLLLGRNDLYGEIPQGIGNLVGLNVLGLEENNFSGNFPSEIGKLQNLGWLILGGNGLSGEIPASIGNLTRLITLGLEQNRFHGSIPASIDRCQQLSLLSLGRNFLNGTIPKHVFSLSGLGIQLDLSQNKFSGDLPIEVGRLKMLTVLDLSGNDLSGNIPSQLGQCESLEYLDMNKNHFHGSIPSSFSSLRGVRFLDLSSNNLSGRLPNFLSTLNMTYFNLSFNDFDGEVPSNGVFSNASAVSLLGNGKLCGGITALRLPNCTHEASMKKKSTKFIKIILSVCVSLFGLVVIFFFLLCLVFKKKKKKAETSKLLLKDPLLLQVSFGDLRRATDDFSSDNLIGKGYFSSVYKGYLEKVGEVVAIKVINLQNHGAARSFASECKTLRSIRHRNLLKTITSCSSIDFHGNDFKALVYEFMANGSLDSWLHVNSEGKGEEGRLTFLQRLNIGIDVASGLDYLHNHCHISIVHCDLKPSNILLDEEMTAHIGDFGLVKLLPELTNYTESSSMGIRGTIGYAAPEYGQGSAVSIEGDIYSYGILLLEMVTRRRPTDEMFMDGLDLHTYGERALSSQVIDIVDNFLLPHGVEEKNKMVNCLVSMVKIGVACSEKSPRNRMDLKDVQHELIMVKNDFLALNSI